MDTHESDDNSMSLGTQASLSVANYWPTGKSGIPPRCRAAQPKLCLALHLKAALHGLSLALRSLGSLHGAEQCSPNCGVHNVYTALAPSANVPPFTQGTEHRDWQARTMIAHFVDANTCTKPTSHIVQIKVKREVLDHTRTHRNTATKLQAEIQRAEEEILDGEEKMRNLDQQITVRPCLHVLAGGLGVQIAGLPLGKGWPEIVIILRMLPKGQACELDH
eukprot:1156753-Pelagomonas_calceolata.AAC.10